MRHALAGVILAASCGGDNTPGFSTGPGVTSVTGTSTSSGSSTTSTSTSSSTGSGGAEDSAASSTTAGGTFDMGPPPDLDPGQPEGCKGKIDFLFVISALGTMQHEQDQLLASFPGFLETIDSKFADFDTHIISVNTDNKWRGKTCESPDFCLNNGSCGPNAEDYVCGSDEGNVWLCDMTRGAGLLFNAGPYAYNKPCELYGGNRYIISGETNPDAFRCIAQVGTFGNDPPLADTLVEAVSQNLNGPDGCNAGFLRPDALLVFVFIMDNEDGKSWLTPKQVRDAVVAAKGGDENAVVALAIVPQLLEGEPVDDCVYNDPPGPQHLVDVIEQFPNHDQGDICADSYAPFFDRAADLVFKACGAFIPQ